jgi:phosphatidate phosphatase APP1
MFLRDLGLAGTRGHKDHKGAAVDAILAANPGLPFVLIGDTGQKDAFVYRDAIARHPGRIERVILREPVVGAPQASLDAIAEIQAAGVACHHARDFGAA